MTKKEQKAFDDLRQQLLLAKAFHLTEVVEPDVMPPNSYTGHASGWWAHAYGDGWRVEPAWTSSGSHGLGYASPSGRLSGSQGSRRLFSNRLLALRSARNTAEANVLRLLVQIDSEIEKELAAKAETTTK